MGRLGVEEAAALPGVDRALLQGGSLVLETTAPGKVLKAVDALTGLDGVMTRTATLEDVYLELTGPAHSGPQAGPHAQTENQA